MDRPPFLMSHLGLRRYSVVEYGKKVNFACMIGIIRHGRSAWGSICKEWAFGKCMKQHMRPWYGAFGLETSFVFDIIINCDTHTRSLTQDVIPREHKQDLGKRFLWKQLLPVNDASTEAVGMPWFHHFAWLLLMYVLCISRIGSVLQSYFIKRVTTISPLVHILALSPPDFLHLSNSLKSLIFSNIT